ncbi:ricin-type beta-trefoil lectin domain protein [Endozoicomonas sp. SM1973]|uniref:Ricin-type beta-trefoil lectin domain protein n=1 Tax=Spartinivicinus marinus TaxID=2994442 RepID=A0A853ICH0_9GAMM|nr:ricin-type beta-trefoil lectin domain protein [Spartinivicinus marinus]MCX4026523.1 ricin-type beta-trefoil lectin domain protein [Spartinivicinus marinus]NYZ66895.1 ricin-type beta-trefoil lectin domain protein [Spartinivicinus marinus]
MRYKMYPVLGSLFLVNGFLSAVIVIWFLSLVTPSQLVAADERLRTEVSLSAFATQPVIPKNNPPIPTQPEKEIVLLQFANGLCLGVLWSSSDNYTPVKLESCINAKYQKWWFDEQNRLHSQLADDKCLQYLAATSINPVGRVFINECSDSPAQQWQLQAGQLIAVAENKRLIVTDNNAGSQLSLVTAEEAPDRQRQLKVINHQQPSSKQVQSVDKANLSSVTDFVPIKFRGDLCLSVAAGLVNVDAPVVIEQCDNSSNQQWQIDHFGRLRPQHSVDMCLDPGKKSTLSAVMVAMQLCNHQLSQRWRIENGVISNLANKQLVLDVESNKANARVLARVKGSWQWQAPTAQQLKQKPLKGENIIEQAKDFLSDKFYQAIQFGDNLCLDLYREANQKNILQLWHCNEPNLQLWWLDSDGRLHPQRDKNKCLSLADEQGSQQKVTLQTCNMNKQQLWRIAKGDMVSQLAPALGLTALGIHGGAKVTVKVLPYWNVSFTTETLTN